MKEFNSVLDLSSSTQTISLRLQVPLIKISMALNGLSLLKETHFALIIGHQERKDTRLSRISAAVIPLICGRVINTYSVSHFTHMYDLYFTVFVALFKVFFSSSCCSSAILKWYTLTGGTFILCNFSFRLIRSKQFSLDLSHFRHWWENGRVLFNILMFLEGKLVKCKIIMMTTIKYQALIMLQVYSFKGNIRHSA